MYAASEGHTEVVDHLLSQPNININCENVLIQNPLDYAKEKNYSEIVELLTKNLQKPQKSSKIKRPKTIDYYSKELKQAITEEKSSNLKEEIELLRQENSRLKEENSTLRKEIQRLKKDNKQTSTTSENEKEIQRLKEENKEITEKNETYENYLTSLKEKTSELAFFDFEEYEEERIIEEGKASIVKIVHKKEQEKYVMKELLQYDHKSMTRFLRESEILFILRHPSIIRVYGFNYGNKTHKPSIILSLEPKSLETMINNNELNNEEKNRIAVEIVLGMRYIHKYKFMHRDLKPSNILLSKNNHVRITDFGFAIEEDLEITQTKGIGTLLFMAPEIFDEEDDELNYTNKVDVYSFGIILIFIVTNKYPQKNIMYGASLKLSDDICKWVRELIMMCVSKKSKNRPSFAEIFEIMKENNFDLFSDSKNQKLTRKQRSMKEKIETRITKIEAFEFQHQLE